MKGNIRKRYPQERHGFIPNLMVSCSDMEKSHECKTSEAVPDHVLYYGHSMRIFSKYLK